MIILIFLELLDVDQPRTIREWLQYTDQMKAHGKYLHFINLIQNCFIYCSSTSRHNDMWYEATLHPSHNM